MPLRNTLANHPLASFLAAKVAQSPTFLLDEAVEGMRLSPLFEVRSVSVDDVSKGGLIEFARFQGWWGFVIGEDRVLGIAELTLTENGIVYAGVNSGDLSDAAVRSLVDAEDYVRQRDATIWFLRSAALFFTALVVELSGEPKLFPVDEARSSESLLARARARISAAINRDATMRKP